MIEPEFASGCNIDVCITLYGSGLTVDKWRTTAKLKSSDGTVCNAAAYFKEKPPNGFDYFTVDIVSVPGCYTGPGYFYAWGFGSGPTTWPDGTRLGNSWDPNSILSGFPTRLVHD